MGCSRSFPSPVFLPLAGQRGAGELLPHVARRERKGTRAAGCPGLDYKNLDGHRIVEDSRKWEGRKQMDHRQIQLEKRELWSTPVYVCSLLCLLQQNPEKIKPILIGRAHVA